MLASGPLTVAGSGAVTRSYQFACALARFGELTLVHLSPGCSQGVPVELREKCSRIIQPNGAFDQTRHAKGGRTASWLRVLRVLAFPWPNQWSGLLEYAFSFWSCDTTFSSGVQTGLKWSRRFLRAAVRLELSLAARFFHPISAAAFCHYADFCGVRSQVRRLLDEVEFDFVWFEHAPNYPFVRELLRGRKAPRLVCNTHNIEHHLSSRREQLASAGAGAHWLRVQSQCLRKVERAAFVACDLVISCSEVDKELALDLVPSAKICVVGNGVDTAYFRPSSKWKRAPMPTLLFTGAFDYGPNVDALRYFITDIFPLVRQQVPQSRFVLAGRKAQTVFDAMSIRSDAVSCVSDPDDIRPEFERAWLFVVPLRVGGGTRLKILEAMAMEVPVVSTHVGAEGVPYRSGEHLLLADDPRDFASAAIQLLQDEQRRTRIAGQAALFVRKNYNWNRLTGFTMDRLKRLLG